MFQRLFGSHTRVLLLAICIAYLSLYIRATQNPHCRRSSCRSHDGRPHPPHTDHRFLCTLCRTVLRHTLKHVIWMSIHWPQVSLHSLPYRPPSHSETRDMNVNTLTTGFSALSAVPSSVTLWNTWYECQYTDHRFLCTLCRTVLRHTLKHVIWMSIHWPQVSLHSLPYRPPSHSETRYMEVSTLTTGFSALSAVPSSVTLWNTWHDG